ncbi:MAG: von Willebrand factor type A domain-containing protein, partial [Bacteroidota bacterium]
MLKVIRLLTLGSLLTIVVACGNMTSGEQYAVREALPTSAPLKVPYSAKAPEPIAGERYAETTENPFVDVAKEAISTFSIDADGGSYANVRRFLQQERMLPPPAAVRTEEFINYFPLNYPFTNQEHPIALNGEISSCPWAEDHRLVRIGIQGKPLATAEIPRSNFVFLVDVSGSMDSRGKLDLLKAGMHRFVDAMSPEDYLSIVTYASRTGVHLKSTSGSDKRAIRVSIDALEAGGGTNGGAGIMLAYEQADKNFIPKGNNRILLGTDGDFNVGLTNHDELISLIENKRKDGVFLTVLGVGSGNYNEATMEQLANKGNGTYEYLDKLAQLEKVFFGERGKFFTVAKDVKVQVEFNPKQVAQYRLIGYENRMLETQDFTDDAKDAGEIGAGQSIT